MANNNWPQNTLSNVTLLIKDGTHGTHKDSPDGIPLLSAKDINNGTINITNNPRRISKVDYETIHRNYEIQKDDILLTIVGTIGRAAIVKDLSNKFTIQRSVGILRMKDSVLPEYCYQYILSNQFQRELTQGAHGLAQSGIYLGELGKKLIPIPSFSIQQKIAEILTSVDISIQKTDQIIKKTEILKKGLLEKLFELEKRNFYKLSEVCWEIVDCPHTTPKYKDYGDFLVVRTPNVRNGELNLKDALYTDEETYNDRIRRYIPKPGDVLLTREAPAGETCLVPKNLKLCLGQRMMCLRPDNTKLLPQYLAYSFYSPIVKRLFQKKSSGTTVFHFNVSEIRKLSIPIPNLDRQQEVVEILRSIDSKIENENKRLQSLKLLKKGLMRDIFSGKVAIN